MMSQKKILVPNVRTRQTTGRTAYTPTHSRDAKVIEEEKPKDNLEDIKKAKKKKMIKIFSIVAVVIIIIGIVFGYFIRKIFGNNQQEEVEIPYVIGRNIDEVIEQYEKLGYKINQTGSDYNSEYEEGEIMSQSPEAGTKTTDKTINVQVSRGTRMVTVSNVEGKDIKVARYELENTAGFVVEEVEQVSDTVAAGIVISQDYKDVERPYGSVIKLTVSSGDGKEQIVVPSVVGMSLQEAQSTLEDMKLTVEVDYGEDESKSNGIVLNQSYPQNSVLKEGDVITITVNRRIINKTFTVGGIPEGTAQSDITVRVSIDGGALNNTTFTYDGEKREVSFTINGYEKVSYSILVNGTEINTGEANF